MRILLIFGFLLTCAIALLQLRPLPGQQVTNPPWCGDLWTPKTDASGKKAKPPEPLKIELCEAFLPRDVPGTPKPRAEGEPPKWFGFILPSSLPVLAFLRTQKSAGDDAPLIEAVEPIDSALLSDSVTLRWRPVPGAVAYRTFVSSVDGAVEWQQAGLGMTSAEPAGSWAVPGLYFWSVSAFDSHAMLLGRKDSTFILLDKKRRERILAKLPSLDTARELTGLAPEFAVAMVRISRATIFEKEQLFGNAAEEYRQVSETFPEPWVNAKILELDYASWQQALLAVRTSPSRLTPPFPVNLPFNLKQEAPWAVVVGINDFVGARDKQKLRFAGHDAAEFAKYLRNAAPDAARVLLLCSQPNPVPPSLMSDGCSADGVTKAQLEQAIQLVFLLSKPKEPIYIFLSGHAEVYRDDQGYFQPYLMTSDSNVSEMESTAVKVSWLKSLIEGRAKAGGQVVLMMDACRANAYSQSKSVPASQPSFRAAATAAAPVLGFLSSEDDKPSYEIPALEHGVFSYFLLEGLRQQKLDGESLFQQLLKSINYGQTPQSLGRQDQLTMPPFVAAGGSVQAGLNTLDRDTRRLLELQRDAQIQLNEYLRGEDGSQTPQAFERGESLMREATAIAPHSPLLQGRLAFFRGRLRTFHRDKLVDTVTDLQQAIAAEPHAAYAYNALGIAYLEAGEYPNAEQCFRDAILRAPKWLYPQHNLAIAYGEMGSYAKAIEQYRTAISLEDRPYLHYDLGILYERLNRSAEARKEFRQSAPMPAAHAESETALLEMDRTARRLSVAGARIKYEDLLRHYPNQYSARHNLALLYYYQKPFNRPEALRLWEWNAALPTSFLPSLMSIARALTIEHDRCALEYYQRLVQLRPANLDFRLEFAAALAKFGKPAEAEEQLGELSAAQQNYPAVLEQRGDLHAQRHLSDVAALFRAAAKQVTSRAGKKCLERKAAGAAEESGKFCLASRDP